MTAPTPTVLTSANDTTDASSYNTASVSPAANRVLYLVSRTSHGTLASPTVTPSGLGLTWTAQADISYSSGSVRRIQLHTAVTGGSAPTPGALTLTLAGSTPATSCGWVLVEADADTSAPLPQDPTASGSGTSMSATLAAPVTSESRPLFAGSWRVTGNATPESGWTELFDTSIASPSTGFAVAWHPTTFDTSPTMTIGSGDWGAIAVEMPAPAAGGAQPPARALTVVRQAVQRASTW